MNIIVINHPVMIVILILDVTWNKCQIAIPILNRRIGYVLCRLELADILVAPPYILIPKTGIVSPVVIIIKRGITLYMPVFGA